MNFNWKEYLALAQDLFSRAESTTAPESYYRAAISRAYYAAFHVARDKIRERFPELMPGGSSDHGVAVYFFKKQNKVPEWVGSSLGKLHEMRKLADYEPVAKNEISDPKQACEDAINRSVRIIKQVDSINSKILIDPPRLNVGRY